ncbi:hypothetical protein AKI39_04015 [Bordetella sp. H567]|uniref:DUF2169 family type VI secretion system accessory protein n=1 Tax=Bordetella sp. H567 TaxID=1697043 RepID=UPI00081CFD9D|nr:DUF2169 domain-containing protein [Bordetella sp. H567]AOB30030.1 hypothetical protein AKI39_04015 [Bordetella sp. H567]
MKTVKPFRLSLLTRPYRWQRANHLGVAVLALVELGDTPRLLPEQDLWILAGEEAGGVLDTGMPKPVPEVLATGYAYARHQQEPGACAVRLKVDGIVDKPLLVFGDRYWLDGRPDKPRPFEAMRVDWTRAYGGPDVPDNPHGIGAADEIVNGVRVRRVPNIESPQERLSAPSQRPAPAGYGALGMDWPQRACHMGSRYDQEWLENDFPGFAPDMDPRFFQAAPPDQRAAVPGTPLGGAAYEIWNMHPERQVLRGRLPDWRARCFASLQADGTALHEIALNLSTAWFFPHRDRVVLIWHGCMPIGEDDGADVRFIMPAMELADAPREMAHYAGVMARRLDSRHGALHAMLDEDLVPRELCAPWMDGTAADAGNRPSQRNQRAGAERRHAQARAELLAQGLDPERYLPALEPAQAAPALADLPEHILRMEQELEKARRGEGDMARVYADPELDGLAATAGVDVQALGRLDIGAPPAAFDPAVLRRQLREARAQPWMRQNQNGGAKAIASAGYLQAAQHFAPPPPMPPHRARRTRERLKARALAGRDARGLPLAGADLSGMDLKGMDFRGADLAGADLTDARLDGCDFTEAVLAGARFIRTSARDACFKRANLGRLTCQQADFECAELGEARLDEAVLEDCVLRGASLGGQSTRTLLRGCDLAGATLSQWMAANVILERCSLDHANIRMCAFMESALQDCDFTSARLTRVGFTRCLFSGRTTFAHADVQASAFAGGADLTGAGFTGATLRNSSLRGAILDGADFTDAMLEACDLSECLLRGADLSRIRAPRSLFVRADLDAASLRKANLIEASLSKATLRDAGLEQANLFRADVSQALIDASTRMQGAYTAGAKRYPLRRTESAA